MSSRAALAAVLFILASGSAAGSTCPTVFRISEGTDEDSSNSYNILFLASGFTESELPAFRKLVQDLASGLVEGKVFVPYRGWINVYRMDLVSVGNLDFVDCPKDCNTRSSLADLIDIKSPVPMGTPIGSADESEVPPQVDLFVRPCWVEEEGRSGEEEGRSAEEEGNSGLGNCSLLWLSAEDQARVLEWQFCAPKINAVVVVANLNDLVGGGLEAALSAEVSLTVVGSSPNRDYAVALLQHEFGHIFGLYDEYVGVVGTPEAPFYGDRNVWRPIPKAFDETQITSLPAELVVSDYLKCAEWDIKDEWSPPIPWQAAMSRCCPTKGIKECRGRSALQHDDCVWSPYDMEKGACSLACSPGLWEGAYYQRECFYRARFECFMKEASPYTTPCEACLGQIHRAMCGHIPQAPACSWPPALPECCRPPQSTTEQEPPAP